MAVASMLAAADVDAAIAACQGKTSCDNLILQLITTRQILYDNRHVEVISNCLTDQQFMHIQMNHISDSLQELMMCEALQNKQMFTEEMKEMNELITYI